MSYFAYCKLKDERLKNKNAYKAISIAKDLYRWNTIAKLNEPILVLKK